MLADLREPRATAGGGVGHLQQKQGWGCHGAGYGKSSLESCRHLVTSSKERGLDSEQHEGLSGHLGGWRACAVAAGDATAFPTCTSRDGVQAAGKEESSLGRRAWLAQEPGTPRTARLWNCQSRLPSGLSGLGALPILSCAHHIAQTACPVHQLDPSYRAILPLCCHWHHSQSPVGLLKALVGRILNLLQRKDKTPK